MLYTLITIKQEKYTFEGIDGETVLEFKRRLIDTHFKNSGLDISAYRIIFRGKILDNEAIMSDCNINGENLVLYITPKTINNDKKPEEKKEVKKAPVSTTTTNTTTNTTTPRTSTMPNTNIPNILPSLSMFGNIDNLNNQGGVSYNNYDSGSFDDDDEGEGGYMDINLDQLTPTQLGLLQTILGGASNISIQPVYSNTTFTSTDIAVATSLTQTINDDTLINFLKNTDPIKNLSESERNNIKNCDVIKGLLSIMSKVLPVNNSNSQNIWNPVPSSSSQNIWNPIPSSSSSPNPNPSPFPQIPNPNPSLSPFSQIPNPSLNSYMPSPFMPSNGSSNANRILNDLTAQDHANIKEIESITNAPVATIIQYYIASEKNKESTINMILNDF